jgi:hypothetical protein
MKRKTRVGIILLATVPLLILATVGGYALVSSDSSGDKPQFPGFRLARPLFAQNGAAFPVDNAGISAYIKVDPASVDFDKVVTTVFNGMVAAGDNYRIGTVPIRQGLYDGRTVNIQVYIDADGWIVAYLTINQPNAEIFKWFEWLPGASLDTTLEEALKATTLALNALFDPSIVSWYYWANPEATHFAAAARAGVGNLYMEIPDGTTVYGKPSYSWHSADANLGSTAHHTGSLTLTKLDTPAILLNGNQNGHAFYVNDIDMDLGAMYTFTASDGTGGNGEHRLGVAIVYKAP